MNTKPNKPLRALTLVDVLVAVALVLVLAAVLLPVLAHRLAKSSRPGCQNNVKQIGLAFRTWEGDYGDRYPMSVPIGEGGSLGSVDAFRTFQIMSNEINNPKVVVCPADTRQAASGIEALANTNVSYFVGLDADETTPTMPLSGDRNLVTNGVAVGPGLTVVTTKTSLTWSAAMHNLAGNVGLADGSVQQTSSRSLQQLFQNSGTNVDRLAIP